MTEHFAGIKNLPALISLLNNPVMMYLKCTLFVSDTHRMLRVKIYPKYFITIKYNMRI